MSYKLLKLGAKTIPNKVLFNRFFSRFKSKDAKWHGLSIICYLLDYIENNKQRVGGNVADKKERYMSVSNSGSIYSVILLAPMCIGITASFISAFFFFVWLYFLLFDVPEAYPWWILISTLCWNLFFANFIPVAAKYLIPKRRVYFDRQNQTASFSWKITGAPLNEFGHPTFPLEEIEAFTSTQNHSQGHGVTHVLTIAHKELGERGAYAEVRTKDNPQNAKYCYMRWEEVLRFMDTSKPLPDSPEFEAVRHLDPLTVEFDITQNRPKYFWRNMSSKQMQKIQEELYDAAYYFDFEKAEKKPKYINKEITQPWLKWPIDSNLIDSEDLKDKKKYYAEVIYRQLVLGL